MHIYSKEQQAYHLSRTLGETWFSRINTVVGLMNIVCFVVSLIRYGGASSDWMSNSVFAVSPLKLLSKFEDCSCNVTVDEQRSVLQHVIYRVDKDNIGYFVSEAVQQARLLFAVAGAQAVLSFVNRAFFEFNVHDLRYNFVLFQKDMTTVWELMLLAMGVVLLKTTSPTNNVVQSYLKCCEYELSKFSMPPIELKISFYGTLFVYLLNMLTACYTMLSEKSVALLLEQMEMEKEVLRRMRNEDPSFNPNHEEEEEEEVEEEEEEETTRASLRPSVVLQENSSLRYRVPSSSSSTVQHSSTAHGRIRSADLPSGSTMVSQHGAASPSPMEVLEDEDEDQRILERLARKNNTTNNGMRGNNSGHTRLYNASTATTIHSGGQHHLLPPEDDSTHLQGSAFVTGAAGMDHTGRVSGGGGESMSSVPANRGMRNSIVNRHRRLHPPPRASIEYDVTTEDTVRM